MRTTRNLVANPIYAGLGRTVVLLQELAPYIDDVRLVLYDQTSPLYEVRSRRFDAEVDVSHVDTPSPR